MNMAISEYELIKERRGCDCRQGDKGGLSDLVLFEVLKMRSSNI